LNAKFEQGEGKKNAPRNFFQSFTEGSIYAVDSNSVCLIGRLHLCCFFLLYFLLSKNCVIFTKDARLPKAAPANASNPSIVRSGKTTIITPMHEFSPGELTVQEAPVKCE
jgi:hypothetical protein